MLNFGKFIKKGTVYSIISYLRSGVSIVKKVNMYPKLLLFTCLLCLLSGIIFAQQRSPSNPSDPLLWIVQNEHRIKELEEQLHNTKKIGFKKVSISVGARFTPFKEIGVTTDDCGCPVFRIGEEQFYFDDFARQEGLNIIKHLWLGAYETNANYKYFHEYGYIGGDELPSLLRKTGFYEQNIRTNLFFNGGWYLGLDAGLGKYTYGIINTALAYSYDKLISRKLLDNKHFEYNVGRISAELGNSLSIGDFLSFNPSVSIGFPYQFGLGLSPKINVPINREKQQFLFVSIDARYYHQWVDKNIILYDSINGKPYNQTDFRFVHYDFVNTSNRLYYGLSLGYEFGL